MAKVKFRKVGEVIKVVREVPTEEVENVSIAEIDNEIEGLQSRIKNRKALKKALQSFQTKNINEGEENFNPQTETV